MPNFDFNAEKLSDKLASTQEYQLYKDLIDNHMSHTIAQLSNSSIEAFPQVTLYDLFNFVYLHYFI